MIFFISTLDIFQFISNLCKSVVKTRKDQNLQYNDMLNSLIEVSKEHPEMTEEIMYKTCVQFFTDGYESAGMVMDANGWMITIHTIHILFPE